MRCTQNLNVRCQASLCERMHSNQYDADSLLWGICGHAVTVECIHYSAVINAALVSYRVQGNEARHDMHVSSLRATGHTSAATAAATPAVCSMTESAQAAI